ncbi:membrane bound O-acyl transferase family protein [Dictyostelium discoideum AX4]|uniref:O-acyltransferase n=1 Tax=Dictyostelium discoideum TaxID=44689 RepID=Q551G5_DICDI|nr:membrane bound O-acyl transferase family protein [Dictyostelium discoideum AX4]EAL69215.1 membrane bound O-acyl transferase family protein [Dictyostelium discoideum AX4]|eukprot:XP_643169.1 membrane bound O-acyl transferase family protein [Dictyostelium discoideum AX4]
MNSTSSSTSTSSSSFTSTIPKNENSSSKATPFYSDQVIFVDGKTYDRKFTISKAFLDLEDPPGVKQSFHKFVHRNRILIFSLILLYFAIDGKNHGINKLVHHASVLKTIFVNPFELIIDLTVMYAMSFLMALFNFCYQNNYFSKWLFRKDNKIALFSFYLIVQLIIGTWSAYFILYRQIYPLGTQFYLGLVAIVLSWKQHSYFIVTNYEVLHKKKINNKDLIIHKKTDSDNNNNNKNTKDEELKIIEFNKEIAKRQISYNEDFKTIWEVSKDYFIFLFTPTLIYDQYYEVRKVSKTLKPEPLKTRIISMLKELYSSMVIMMTAHYINVEYIFPVLTEELSLYSFLKIIIPTEINFQLQYYLLYHCALSLLADISGFNDRLSFYNDYWAAVTTKSILTQWSKPVHNWLYRHMFSDMKSLLKVKTVICLFTTMIFSGFFHEFIVTSITKQVCMPWSTFSLISCALFIMVENKFPKLTNSAYYHAFVRFLLVVGHGLFYFSYFYFWFSEYDIGYYRTCMKL